MALAPVPNGTSTRLPDHAPVGALLASSLLRFFAFQKLFLLLEQGKHSLGNPKQLNLHGLKIFESLFIGVSSVRSPLLDIFGSATYVILERDN